MASQLAGKAQESGLRRRKLLMIAVALSVGLLLRLWFINHAASIVGDTFIYGDIAKTWLAHGVYGFSRDSGPPIPTLIRLPGYPLFLVLCFLIFGLEHYGAVLYTQVALDLLTCLLVASVAGRLFGRRAFYAALWLAALCPFTASYAAAGLAETLTLFSIALAYYALLRWQQALASQSESGEVGEASPYNRWLYLLAAALACSILLRPEQSLLAAAILSAMLWLCLRLPIDRKLNPRIGLYRIYFKTVIPVLLTAFLTLLPLVPWTARNWRTFHVVQPLAPRYANDPGEAIPLSFYRWFRTWAIDFSSTEDVYWNYNGAPVTITDLPNRAFDNDSQYARTEALLNEYNQKALDSPTFETRFAALAAERVHASPIRYYAALPVARLLNMLLRPRVELLPIQLEWWRFSEQPRQTAFSVAYGSLNLAYLVFAAIGLRRWYRRTLALPSADLFRSHNLALVMSMSVFVILRCVLLLTIDNSEPRYTLEFFPVLILWWAALFPRTVAEA